MIKYMAKAIDTMNEFENDAQNRIHPKSPQHAHNSKRRENEYVIVANQGVLILKQKQMLQRNKSSSCQKTVTNVTHFHTTSLAFSAEVV